MRNTLPEPSLFKFCIEISKNPIQGFVLTFARENETCLSDIQPTGLLEKTFGWLQGL